ncbi:MAG TPA: DoxX family protein [Polyangiaceae bacterium]|jgi:uncharacterized membrane protein YphA (DoxX/SURF4 family)
MLRLIAGFERRVSNDTRDLIFRGLFSSIFLGLGSEHLLDDRLIQHFMPGWVGYPMLASRVSGLVLLIGGLSILTGYRMQLGARVLGAFLFVVTLSVHLPGVFRVPADIPADSAWLWTVFQRSNLVKNLCLFGVCVHLTTHAPGRFSIDAWRARRLASEPPPG